MFPPNLLSWLGDLAIAIGHLPCCPPVWNPLLATEDSITKLIADNKVSMNTHIDSVIALSAGRLLRGQLERDDNGTLHHQTLCF